MASDRGVRHQPSQQEINLLRIQFQGLMDDFDRLRGNVGRTVDMMMMVLGVSNHQRRQDDGQPKENIRSESSSEEEESEDGEEDEEEFDDDDDPLKTPLLNLRTSVENLVDGEEYSVKEAAVVLGMSENTLRIKATKKGEIAHSRKGKGNGGGQLVFTGGELKRYAGSQEKQKRKTGLDG
jgi:hypothetical protein